MQDESSMLIDERVISLAYGASCGGALVLLNIPPLAVVALGVAFGLGYEVFIK